MRLSGYLKYSIFIIPLVFLWAGLNIHIAKFGNDPNYVYLVNALAICNGKTVGYIDHPGTPVIQIGALTVAVKHLLDNPNNQSLTARFLENPHIFMLAIRSVLLFLNTLILVLIGWVAVKKTGAIWLAMLLQSSTLISANVLDHVWTKISPEPLLFFITSVFVILIIIYYASEDKNSYKYVFIFSLVSGLGLATKATFLPLIIFPLLILSTYKKKLVYLVGIIPSFVLFTIPIIPEYENMYYWFRGLTNHSGIYGHGEKGFIDVSTYFPNILQITVNNPVFSAIVILGIFTVLARLFAVKFRYKALKIDDKFLFGLIASSIFGMLLVAKHYHSNHYLLPELLLSGITVYFILKIVVEKIQRETVKKLIYAAVAIGFIVFVSFKQPPRIEYIDYGYQITNEEMDSTNIMIEQDFSDYTKIYYYPNSLNIYSALNFGDVYTQRRMLPEIKRIHGDIYFYHSISGIIKNWNTEVYLDDLVENEGNKLLLVGGPRDENEVQKMWQDGFPLNKIYKGRLQAIYTLDTMGYNYMNLDKKMHEEVIFCDAEKLMEDGKSFLFSNGQGIGNAEHRSEEVSRSGNYSVKMNESVEYAFEFKIFEVTAGERYEITVWRKSAEGNGTLVAAAEDSSIFYKAQNDAVETDESGWGLLKIKFEVPSELDGKTLKFYLWNKDKETVYFDDFTIRKELINLETEN